MTNKSDPADIPLLDEVVEHDIAAKTREIPPPNLDLFKSEPVDPAVLQTLLSGRINAWLATALPGALHDIEAELLYLLEQRLATELPTLIAQALQNMQNSNTPDTPPEDK